jgi:hypothetical protein
MLVNYSFPHGLRKKLHDEMPQLMCVVIQMKCEKSVNQKINTLNINNNKSSAQPNPINQFSLSDGDENIFSVSENWFIGKTFVFARWEKLLLKLSVENSWRNAGMQTLQHRDSPFIFALLAV